MRRLILLLLLATGAYTVWFYTIGLNDSGKYLPLIRTELSTVDKIVVAGKAHAFKLQRAENGEWLAVREQKILFKQNAQVDSFFSALELAVADSVLTNVQTKPSWTVVDLTFPAKSSPEKLRFHFPVDQSRPVYAQLEGGEDYLVLAPTFHRWRTDFLDFDGYREMRLLDLSPNSVDSLYVLKKDSILWGVNSGELAATASRFIVPAAAHYADHFDEIRHQDRAYATIKLYAGDGTKTVTVYRDSLWPQPFVLVGEDYPRRFLGYERLR